METIVLETAFAWICPTCGMQNYENAVRAEMDDEDKDFMEALSESMINDWVQAPTKVCCTKCKLIFETDVE
jgi:hypothetical protein